MPQPLQFIGSLPVSTHTPLHATVPPVQVGGGFASGVEESGIGVPPESSAPPVPVAASSAAGGSPIGVPVGPPEPVAPPVVASSVWPSSPPSAPPADAPPPVSPLSDVTSEHAETVDMSVAMAPHPTRARRMDTQSA